MMKFTRVMKRKAYMDIGLSDIGTVPKGTEQKMLNCKIILFFQARLFVIKKM
jgi:hypothetical protein